jgi:hypothetical protein
MSEYALLGINALLFTVAGFLMLRQPPSIVAGQGASIVARPGALDGSSQQVTTSNRARSNRDEGQGSGSNSDGNGDRDDGSPTLILEYHEILDSMYRPSTTNNQATSLVDLQRQQQQPQPPQQPQTQPPAAAVPAAAAAATAAAAAAAAAAAVTRAQAANGTAGMPQAQNPQQPQPATDGAMLGHPPPLPTLPAGAVTTDAATGALTTGTAPSTLSAPPVATHVVAPVMGDAPPVTVHNATDVLGHPPPPPQVPPPVTTPGAAPVGGTTGAAQNPPPQQPQPPLPGAADAQPAVSDATMLVQGAVATATGSAELAREFFNYVSNMTVQNVFNYDVTDFEIVSRASRALEKVKAAFDAVGRLPEDIPGKADAVEIATQRLNEASNAAKSSVLHVLRLVQDAAREITNNISALTNSDGQTVANISSFYKAVSRVFQPILNEISLKFPGDFTDASRDATELANSAREAARDAAPRVLGLVEEATKNVEQSARREIEAITHARTAIASASPVYNNLLSTVFDVKLILAILRHENFVPDNDAVYNQVTQSLRQTDESLTALRDKLVSIRAPLSAFQQRNAAPPVGPGAGRGGPGGPGAGRVGPGPGRGGRGGPVTGRGGLVTGRGRVIGTGHGKVGGADDLQLAGTVVTPSVSRGMSRGALISRFSHNQSVGGQAMAPVGQPPGGGNIGTSLMPQLGQQSVGGQAMAPVGQPRPGVPNILPGSQYGQPLLNRVDPRYGNPAANGGPGMVPPGGAYGMAGQQLLNGVDPRTGLGLGMTPGGQQLGYQNQSNTNQIQSGVSPANPAPNAFTTPLTLLTAVTQFIEVDGKIKYADFLMKKRSELEALYNEHIVNAAAIRKQDSAFILIEEVPDEVEHIVNVGDLHGNVRGLVEIMQAAIAAGYMDASCSLKAKTRWVFTGDYVDSGFFGVILCVAVAWFRAINPDRVVIVNGNHEVYKPDRDSLHFKDKDRDGSASPYWWYTAAMGESRLADEVYMWWLHVLKPNATPQELDFALQNPLSNCDVWLNISDWFKTRCPVAYFAKFGGKWINYVHGFVDPSINLPLTTEGGSVYLLTDATQVENTLWNDVGTQHKKDSSEDSEDSSEDSSEDRKKKKRKTLLYADVDQWMKSNDVFAVIRGHQDQRNLQLLMEDSKSLGDCRDQDKGLFIASRDRYPRADCVGKKVMCDGRVKSTLIETKDTRPQLKMNLTADWSGKQFNVGGNASTRALRVFTFSSAEPKFVCASAAFGVLKKS